ncbi:MAG: arginine deiminase [Saprospiraceae bacterium]|nr:arginine deiminase [Saprospiraceae bacterium]
MEKIHVSNEIGSLLRVIIHRPDSGISRISPKRAEELLFDDIVHLPSMQAEHDIFTAVLRSFVGEKHVYETGNLILEALNADKEKKEVTIESILDYEELPPTWKEKLISLPNEQLAKLLITGYDEVEDFIYFDPIPNFIFTRDIAVTINDHVIVTKAAKMARARENLLTRFIFWAHPLFQDAHQKGRVINLNKIEDFPPSRKGETVSIEGGDMMVISKDYLLVGCSERTNQHAIESLKRALFEKNVIDNIVQVNIPSERSFMHIDTLFTMINTNHVAAFKPIIMDGLGSNVIVHKKDGSKPEYPSVEAFFKECIHPDMEFIPVGNGESPYQEREQWTDGCNLVALKPGVALTYDRNPKTEIAFRRFGYQLIHAEEYLGKVRSGEINPAELENTIINLPSNELSRARGGSHCMTCPVQRADI